MRAVSAARFPLKSFNYNVIDLSRSIDLLYDVAGEFFFYRFFSRGNGLFLGNVSGHVYHRPGLAVDLYRDLHGVVLHGLLIVLRPLLMEDGLSVSIALPQLLR